MPDAILFSTKVIAGRRTFFFDVKRSQGQKPYVRITETFVRESGNKSVMTIQNEEIDDFKIAIAQTFGFINTIK